MSLPKRDRSASSESRIHRAMGHSSRVEILCELIDGPISPSGFVRKRDPNNKLNNKELGLVSYHFNVLAQYGLIVLKEKIPRRGAQENVFKLAPDLPALDLILESAMGCSAAAELSQTRVMQLDVDDRGFQEVSDATRRFKKDLEKAKKASRKRQEAATPPSTHQLQILYTDLASEVHG